MNNYVHRFLESTIGSLFGKDVTCREPVHRCDDYQPGVLVEFGRTGIKVCIQVIIFLVYCHNSIKISTNYKINFYLWINRNMNITLFRNEKYNRGNILYFMFRRKNFNLILIFIIYNNI